LPIFTLICYNSSDTRNQVQHTNYVVYKFSSSSVALAHHLSAITNDPIILIVPVYLGSFSYLIRSSYHAKIKVGTRRRRWRWRLSEDGGIAFAVAIAVILNGVEKRHALLIVTKFVTRYSTVDTGK
jgi:hypothetical protein